MNYFKKFFNKNKIAIVIQGTSDYVPEVKNAWKNFKDDLIFSTWKGCEDKYSENDIVIFNKEPNSPGPFNFNYQKISSYNGLKKAKELGYKYALKIRSDYLPTNDKEFIKLLDFNKLNFLMWNYTSFLWLSYPSLNGYLDDHFSFGPIDEMIELWDIKDNFCYSPEIMLTWSYISKLKNKISLNLILNKLNNNNNIFYIKFNNSSPTNIFAHNKKTNQFGKELYGRYESVFNLNKEYIYETIKIGKFLNDNYLKFLKYYVSLPKITILNENDCELNNIIYPEKKLEIVSDNNNII